MVETRNMCFDDYLPSELASFPFFRTTYSRNLEQKPDTNQGYKKNELAKLDASPLFSQYMLNANLLKRHFLKEKMGEKLKPE